MRVTTQLQHEMLSGYIGKNQSDVYRLQEQAASGKRMTVASDDPQAWTVSQRLHTQESLFVRYEENSALLDSRLGSMDVALGSISDILQTASEISVKASQGMLNKSDRAAFAEQVDQLLEELVTRANSTQDGSWLFGGVQSGSAPFTLTRDADGRIDSVSYAGSQNVAELEISDGNTLPTQLVGGGSDGALISDDADAFAALIDMRDRLLNGENLAETGTQQLVDDAFERTLVCRAVIGAQMERLDLIGVLRSKQQTLLQEQINETDNVDVTEVVAELSAKNVAYEAALALSAQAMKISLLNYM